MPTKLYFRSDLYDQRVTPGSFNQGATDGIAFNGYFNGSCHIVLEASTTYASRIKRSVDGINWKTVSTLSGSPPAYYGPLAYGDGVWVTADTTGKYYKSVDDGETWTLAYTDAIAVLSNSITYANGVFVSCFATASGTADMLTSTDGSSWSRPLVFGPAALNSAAYSPTLEYWIVAGAQGQILRSRDPTVSWETGIFNSTHTQYKVAWCPIAAIFVIVGGTGLIKTSPDGVTWTVRTSNTANTLYTVIEFAGVISAFGQNSTITSSSNGGVTWTVDTTFPEQVGIIYTAWDGGSELLGNLASLKLYVANGYGCIYKVLDSVTGSLFEKVGSELSSTQVTYNTGQLSPWGVNDLKLLSTTIGTGQTVSTATDWASNSVQNQLFGIFATLPIAFDQTIGVGTITLNVADSESSNQANFWINGIHAYVWSPTNPNTNVSISSTIVDYAGASLGGSEGSTTESVTHIVNIPATAVDVLKGDVIIVEVWSTYAHQGTVSSYNVSFYYNGTTENTTENAAVTNHASYIEFSETIEFAPIIPTSRAIIL